MVDSVLQAVVHTGRITIHLPGLVVKAARPAGKEN